MKCNKQQEALLFLIDEMDDQQKHQYQDHLKTCIQCQTAFHEMKKIQLQLESRSLPAPPANLAKRCIHTIRNQTQSLNSKQVRNPIAVFSIRRKPILQWAILTIVFGLGLGLGKMLFDTPQWFATPKNWLGQPLLKSTQSRSALHQYLLSVETLLLDISNLQSSEIEEGEQWDVEVEIARKILQRTIQMKKQIKNNPELTRLVSDIEWVLEDMIDYMDYEMVNLPENIQLAIQERQLLSRLYEFMS